MANDAKYKVQVSRLNGYFENIEVPFIVPTPVPYVVDLIHYESEVEREAIKARMVEDCQLLYEVLAMLGISLKTARDAGYTLNIDTRDRLRRIAWEQNNQAANTRIDERQW